MNEREIGLETPCTLDWRKMTPAQGGRFCGDCKKVVRDLSRMSESEARALVAKERHEGLCVRMIVDRDGNVFFGGDALVSASLLSRAKRAAIAAAAVALPFGSQACAVVTEPLGISHSEQTTDSDHPTGDYRELMGGMTAPNEKEIAQDPDASDASPDASSDAAADAADASPDADAGLPPFE